MSPRAPGAVLLPARPRRRDWLAAGASAGALLGTAELWVAAATGSGLPPRVGAAVVGTDGVLLAALGLGLGAWLRIGERRASRSAMGGALVGAQILAVGVAPLWLGPDARSAGLALVTAGLAVAAGLGAARLADRAERAGLAPNLPLLWLGTGLLLAGGGRGLGAPAPLAARWPVLALLGLGAGLVAGAWVLPRLRPRPPHPLARIATGCLLVAFASASARAILPWLLYGPDIEPWVPAPPNLLVLSLRGDDAFLAALPAEVLAWGGVRYERVAPREAPPEALLRLPDGAALPSELRARGYVTAAILPGGDGAWPAGPLEVDAEDGPLRVLETHGAATAAGPFLLGPASPLLPLLGLDARVRTPLQVGSAARRWLLLWRSTRAPAPFLLWVELRSTGPAESELEESLAGLFATLDKLELAERTLVAVVAPGFAVVRPPAGWRAFRPGVRRAGVLRGPELSAELLRLASRDGEQPLRLPGFREAG